MKTGLYLSAIAALTLTACESTFAEPDFPTENSDLSQEGTRNQDASDSTGASGFSIVVEDENVVDLDFKL